MNENIDIGNGLAVHFESNVRKTWRNVHRASVVYGLIFLYVFFCVICNRHLEWGVVWHYLFTFSIIRGLFVTLGLTVATVSLGGLLATVLALGSLSGDVIIRNMARAYIWIFRGVPLLVQLIFWYNIAILYPNYYIGFPYLPHFSISGKVNDVMTPEVAALIGLSLNEAAYMAEIIRAGIESVDVGQTEVALMMGMTRAQTMRRVVLPQAFRAVLPAIGNETIGTLKTTSLVSVLSIGDLLYSVQSIYARTFQVIPLLLVASIWYLTATTLLTALLSLTERHAGKHKKNSPT